MASEEIKFCKNCRKNVVPFWELWCCDMNPEGLIPEPKPHGNIIGDTVTCEDGYCNPRDEDVTETVMQVKDRAEYIKTHEVHERCPECYAHFEE